MVSGFNHLSITDNNIVSISDVNGNGSVLHVITNINKEHIISFF